MIAFWCIALVTCFSGLCLADLDEGIDASSPSRELQISEIDYFVNTEEGRNILMEEYKSIEGGNRMSADIGVTPENIKKNRYDDMPAVDATRVHLNLEAEHDPEDTDYINANYIDGTNYKKEYIATQGPVQNSVKDFWRMIWQENATKIIMLANLFEHGKPKVHKYWPEVTCTYGDLTVAKLSEQSMPDINHVVRVFSLKKVGVNEPRIIRHFHYTGWPDLGVPDDRLSIIGLLRQARMYRPDSHAPIVVHCSAGVGRTGTVIMTDSMLQKARQDGIVDFPKKLDQMRMQRTDVVEKPEQYVFAHQAVDDLFNNPETETYLKHVEKLHKTGDTEYKVPAEMEQLVQRLKYHNIGMSAIIQALANGYDKSDR